MNISEKEILQHTETLTAGILAGKEILSEHVYSQIFSDALSAVTDLVQANGFVIVEEDDTDAE